MVNFNYLICIFRRLRRNGLQKNSGKRMLPPKSTIAPCVTSKSLARRYVAVESVVAVSTAGRSVNLWTGLAKVGLLTNCE